MNLSDRVFLYQKTGIGEKKLLDEIYIAVYRYISNLYSLDEDTKGDFFMCFFPRIKKLVLTYKDVGKSFQAFLFTHLRFQLRTFMRERNEMGRKQRLVTSYPLYKEIEMLSTISEEAPDYDAQMLHTDEKSSLKDLGHIKSNRKRILFLLLKHAEHIPMHNITKISDFLNIPEVILTSYIDEAHSKHIHRKKKRVYLENRREYYYFQMQYALSMVQGSVQLEEKENYKQRAMHYTKHFYRVQKELNNIPPSLSHREVGEILNIPKGTIDSGLYYLRDQLRDNVAANRRREKRKKEKLQKPKNTTQDLDKAGKDA